MTQPTPEGLNPSGNGFIERYFRTLRKDLFRKLKENKLDVSQKNLDDFASIKNHCYTVGKTGKTPAELANVTSQIIAPESFEFEKVTIHNWSFWHIKGIHGMLHAYLREDKLHFLGVK